MIKNGSPSSNIVLTAISLFSIFSQSFNTEDPHDISQTAEELPKIIADLMENKEYFRLLQPYIDNYFEKLMFQVIHKLNVDKLKAIDHLKQDSRREYLLAKAEWIHRFREAIFYMENTFVKLYKIFVRDLGKALNTKAKKAKKGKNAKKAKKAKKVKKAKKGGAKHKTPKEPMLSQTEPDAYKKRVDEIVKLVGVFAKRYSEEYDKIHRQWFGNVQK